MSEFQQALQASQQQFTERINASHQAAVERETQEVADLLSGSGLHFAARTNFVRKVRKSVNRDVTQRASSVPDGTEQNQTRQAAPATGAGTVIVMTDGVIVEITTVEDDRRAPHE